MDYIWNNIEHKVSTKLLEFINWYSKYVFSLLKLQITIIYRINLKKNFSSSILRYAIIRWIIRFSRYILFTYFLSKFKLWKLTIQGLAQIKPNSASATVKLHDLLNNVRGSFKSNPEQFKEISSDACSLVYRFQVSPSRRGVQRKSSFIPVRGFTLPRSPIYARPSIRGALLARGMRLFTRLLSSSHRALVDPQPRVLNQFDRHRHKYTGRANLQPAFAIVAPEVEERKFWRRSAINDEKTTFSFFLSFSLLLLFLLLYLSSCQLFILRSCWIWFRIEEKFDEV